MSAAAPREAVRRCHAVLAEHGKSFALAGRLLGRAAHDDAAVVYAWCRRADDAVDLRSRDQQPAALAQLRSELDAVYAGQPPEDPVLQAFAEVVARRGLPRDYPEELLAGMEMDVVGTRYATRDDLAHYCFRVAGTVGLMMCHVLEVDAPARLRHAAHLGMAMQLTNIARDVAEDWARQRVYLPAEWLPEELPEPGGQIPPALVPAFAEAVRRVLAEAERFYASGAAGIPGLPWRSALAIAAARRVYSAIGDRVAAQEHDVTRGRAFVPIPRKLWLVARAIAEVASDAPRRARVGFAPARLATTVRFPRDVLPL